MHIAHDIIQQCAFVHVGPENVTMGFPQPSATRRLRLNMNLH